MTQPPRHSEVAAGFSPRYAADRSRCFNPGPFPSAAILCLALLLGFAATAIAQKPITLHFDPATTHVNWTLATNVHSVHGTFKLRSGVVTVDPATGEASGLIVVDAASGESAEPSRDRRMHAIVLESDRYPAITFRPTRVTGAINLAAAGQVNVAGIFNLHGQDHPLQLTINLHPQTQTQPGQPAAAALTTQFTIPYVAWGLKDPNFILFRCDKQVTLDIDATATQTSPR